jgi:hypothetical protein
VYQSHEVWFSDTIGANNTASGVETLSSNTAGDGNTAVGEAALQHNTTGSANIALGYKAGSNLTSGDNNIYLGHPGAARESNTMRLGKGQTRTIIAGIASTPVSGRQVFINSNGLLGIMASCARYKRDIHDIGVRSRGLFQLRPVTFRYKQDAQEQWQYGLIAEEVAKVYPELVVRGAKGVVESVQYHELIPMLLNEVQHQQQVLSAQAPQIAELQAQNARLQAVVGQLQQRDEEQRTQNAALAARLERLEVGAIRTATMTTR